jgi:hypothetical protein
MPEAAPLDDEAWWWLHLDCRWGSSHTRLRDFVAPQPPWEKPDKWQTPLAWLRQLPER